MHRVIGHNLLPGYYTGRNNEEMARVRLPVYPMDTKVFLNVAIQIETRKRLYADYKRIRLDVKHIEIA
jgi:hypothetical protein